MPFNVLSIGASRNIGYFTALYLLAEGHKVTLLIRRKTTFDEDEKMQEYLKSGQAKLFIGDALLVEDVKKVWSLAAENGPVDYVITSVGAKPSVTLKGIVMDNPTVVASCTHALLSAWPHSQTEGIEHTKLISITSTGLTKKAHKSLPWPLKCFHNIVLPVPHRDKRVTEHYLAYCAAIYQSYECTPEEITSLEKTGNFPPNWQEGLKKGDWLNAVIVRPSLLTDGKSLCETEGAKAVRAGPEDLPSAWTISRKDVAWFIVNQVTKDWDAWKGKAVTVSY